MRRDPGLAPLGPGGPGDDLRVRSDQQIQGAIERMQRQSQTGSVTLDVPAGAYVTDVEILHTFGSTPSAVTPIIEGNISPLNAAVCVLAQDARRVRVRFESNLGAPARIQVLAVFFL